MSCEYRSVIQQQHTEFLIMKKNGQQPRSHAGTAYYLLLLEQQTETTLAPREGAIFPYPRNHLDASKQHPWLH